MRHEIQIGQLLDKRFEVRGLIEKSGMGAVYKAFDCSTRRLVVLKFPPLEFEGNPGNSARFAREARIIGKLDHPGIPKVIAVAEKSRPYVVMEYVEGETLYDILERSHLLPVREALQFASRLCEILEYMHQQGVFHCDLKPGNILISDDGRPHVLDFGIAKGPAADALGWFSSTFGTPEYMAPEQIQGNGVDGRTDVFSLGAILYEAVTGARPFQADRLPGQLRFPRDLNINLSEQLEEIILHAMAPNPSDRYWSAAAMKMELDSPEQVLVTGMYRNPRKANVWPKRLRLTGIILSIAATPFILFYLFLLMFERQLAR